MSPRRKNGRETWQRLLEWDQGSTAAERLAAHVLRLEGFKSVDPSHPLGGRDSLKDIVCELGGKKFVGAAFFPRGKVATSAILRKMKADLPGVAKAAADGLAFVTNQEIGLADRQRFLEACAPAPLELIHLERIASVLDAPQSYGLRLEFLDIEMTKEEQLAFISIRDAMLVQMNETLEKLLAQNTDGTTKGKRRKNSLPIVFAHDMNDMLGSLGRKLHECVECAEIFEVFDSFLTSSSAVFGNKAIVTCPSCSKVQRYAR
ncbi:MAG: hypothetical protein WD771_07725 [Gemmatimonadaceae bacterium]